MTTESSDAFLSGQGIPVDPRSIEGELARLWGPAAERQGGPDLERPMVTRVALANLIVADLAPGPSRVEDLLATVAARYPSRMIVLRAAEGLGRAVRAEVSALCHLPAPGRPQVCSEQILLTAGPEGLDLLPGAVRPILEADMPTVLWWAGDPRPVEALFRDLADLSTRLIVDLPDPQADPAALRLALDPEVNPYSRDLAWFAITTWRELIAQFFDPPGSEAALSRLRSVQIRVQSPTPAPLPRAGAWLAAWLAGQLSWRPKRLGTQADGSPLATFDAPLNEVLVSFHVAADPALTEPRIAGVTLAAGPAGTYRLARVDGSPGVRARCEDAPGHDHLPRLLLAPEWDAPRRLAAAIESAREDPPYRHALPHMLWLLGDR